jgi:hypothetical protein
MIDAFLGSTVPSKSIISETRNIWRQDIVIDGYVETKNDIYIIETSYAFNSLDKDKIKSSIARLFQATKYYDHSQKNISPILLIAITERTKGKRLSTEDFSDGNIKIQYIEFNYNEINSP